MDGTKKLSDKEENLWGEPLKNRFVRELNQRTNETYRSMRVDSLLKDINNKIKNAIKEGKPPKEVQTLKTRAQHIVDTINESAIDGKSLFKNQTIVQIDGKFVLEKDDSSTTGIIKELLKGESANKELTPKQEQSIINEFSNENIEKQMTFLDDYNPARFNKKSFYEKRLEVAEEVIKRLNNKPDSAAARRIVEILNDGTTHEGKSILGDYTITKDKAGKWELKFDGITHFTDHILTGKSLTSRLTETRQIKELMQTPDQKITPTEEQKPTKDTKSPQEQLFDAIRNRNIKEVKEALDEGADVNGAITLDYLTTTALHEAAKTGNIDIIRLLMKKGANPKAQDSLGKTPFDKAASNDDEKAVKALSNINYNQ